MAPAHGRKDENDKDTKYDNVSQEQLGIHDVATSISNTGAMLDARTAEELEREVDAHVGVKRVEAAGKVFGQYSRWILFVSLGLASYIYSLDRSTTGNYLSFAASSFGEHSLISGVQVAQLIIIAAGKPVIAKVADVSSRAYVYLGVLIFYVIGYVVIASSSTLATMAGGIVIYSVGDAGLELLMRIVVADITTLKWRGLVSALTSLPFVVNSFVGPNIVTSVLGHGGWRWGYGMFAILVPATLLPLITTLFWAEHKAKRLGIVDTMLANSRSAERRSAGTSGSKPPFISRFFQTLEQLDVVGLLLLGAAVALILLPLTLAENANGQWKNPSMISMLVVGCVLLIFFAAWDLIIATKPVIPSRFLRNRTVMLACLIGFLDFFSYFLNNVYLYSFVLVAKPWSTLNATYFMQTQTLALTIFGILAGAVMWWTRRYKVLLIVSSCIRLVGCGLMIDARGADASTAEMVMAQLLQGIGSVSAIAMEVGAQASVTHADVAMVTAAALLTAEIGGAIGSAVAGMMWSSMLPDNLAKNLPQLSDDQRAELFDSIINVLGYPREDPVREGVIAAYESTMKTMAIVGTAIGAVPVLLALFLPDWYLGDTQNAVDKVNLEGEVVGQDFK